MAPWTLEPIGDAPDASLEPFRTLRRVKALGEVIRFVAEGAKVVDRLLESDHLVESVLATEAALARIRPLLDARPEAVRVIVARTREEIHAVTGYESEDLKAVGRRPRRPTLEGVLASAPRPRLLCLLDGVTNAENVGVVVRNAGGLGVHAAITAASTCSPYLTRAIRTSMGAVFRLPVVEGVDAADAVERLREAGVRCVAAHPRPGAVELPRVELTADVCVVLGAEGEGVSPQVLARCDDVAAVPMASGVDSLNVASAAAAFFYEAWRQRRGRG